MSVEIVGIVIAGVAASVAAGGLFLNYFSFGFILNDDIFITTPHSVSRFHLIR